MDTSIEQHRLTAIRIVAAQLLVAAAAAGVLLVVRGQRDAFSALVGGAISALGSSCLALRMFRTAPDGAPARIVRAFYTGEAAKIGLTVLLFAFALVRLDVNVLVMLLTYLATQLVNWFALLATGRRRV